MYTRKIDLPRLRFCFLPCACLLVLLFSMRNLQAQPMPTLGMVSSLENDSLLHAAGFRAIGTSVGSLISPS
ncbi:MAG: hypothetical protein EOO14_15905, partial [Chitinophagaceae bacterium]